MAFTSPTIGDKPTNTEIKNEIDRQKKNREDNSSAVKDTSWLAFKLKSCFNANLNKSAVDMLKWVAELTEYRAFYHQQGGVMYLTISDRDPTGIGIRGEYINDKRFNRGKKGVGKNMFVPKNSFFKQGYRYSLTPTKSPFRFIINEIGEFEPKTKEILSYAVLSVAHRTER